MLEYQTGSLGWTSREGKIREEVSNRQPEDTTQRSSLEAFTWETWFGKWGATLENKLWKENLHLIRKVPFGYGKLCRTTPSCWNNWM